MMSLMTIPPRLTETLPARFGMKSGAKGAHTSRTMMLAELVELFQARPNVTTSSAAATASQLTRHAEIRLRRM